MHISGEDNFVADTLSRVKSIQMPVNLDLKNIAKGQLKDEELQTLLKHKTTSCKLVKMVWGPEDTSV